MQKYIAVKAVETEPMTGGQFCEQVEEITFDFDHQDGYKIVYPSGYASWLPKEVFEEVYRPTDEMTS